MYSKLLPVRSTLTQGGVMHEMRVIDIMDAHRDPARFSSEVTDTLRHDGFLALSGHEVRPSFLMECKQVTHRLFACDPDLLETKYGRPETYRQRGYAPLGSEHGVRAPVADHKAFWMIRLPEQPDDPSDNPFGPNVWPDQEVPEFRTLMSGLMAHLVAVSHMVLRGLERGFNLPRGRLVDMTHGSETMLRPIYYPDGEAPAGATRSYDHEDINLITVLPTSGDGLQLFLDGEWHDAKSRPGLLYVNTGEMLAQVAGVEGLVPTTHRVVMPPADKRTPRYSWPLFCHGRRSVELRPGLKVGDWLDERIKQITKH